MINESKKRALKELGITIRHSVLEIALIDKEGKEIGQVLFSYKLDECHVTWLNIAEKYQHMGLGTLLLYCVIKEAQAFDAASLKLSAVLAAKMFYLNIGFFEDRSNSKELTFPVQDQPSIDKLEEYISSVISNLPSHLKKRVANVEHPVNKKIKNKTTLKETKSLKINHSVFWNNMDTHLDDVKLTIPREEELNNSTYMTLAEESESAFMNFIGELSQRDSETCPDETNANSKKPKIEPPSL